MIFLEWVSMTSRSTRSRLKGQPFPNTLHRVASKRCDRPHLHSPASAYIRNSPQSERPPRRLPRRPERRQAESAADVIEDRVGGAPLRRTGAVSLFRREHGALETRRRSYRKETRRERDRAQLEHGQEAPRNVRRVSSLNQRPMDELRQP